MPDLLLDILSGRAGKGATAGTPEAIGAVSACIALSGGMLASAQLAPVEAASSGGEGVGVPHGGGGAVCGVGVAACCASPGGPQFGPLLPGPPA